MRSNVLLRAAVGLTLVASALTIPTSRVAASQARMDCSNAVATGSWGVILPEPGTLDGTYRSRFWHKYEGGTSASGYDWKADETWFFGDTQESWWWAEGDAEWTSAVKRGDWSFYGLNYNTGTIHVWEEKVYYDGSESVGFEIGSCELWSFSIFVPYAL